MTPADAYRNLIAAIVVDPRRVARLDDLYQRDAGKPRVITEARLVEVSLNSTPPLFPGCGVISITPAKSGGVDAAALSRQSEPMTPATGEATLRPRST